MDLQIGDRIECDKHRGTILFIGEVPPTRGTWLGVEWDDPTRGKHDGFHEGIKYFSTKKSNAGSFIRFNKISPTRNLYQALRERYIVNSNDNFADESLIQELKDEMNAPFLELVGLDKIGQKQSNLNELKIAVVSQMCINQSHENLKDICPDIQELDLSGNLLNSWVPVADIAQQLVHLEVLNVSDNKLSIPENPRELEGAFKKLKYLMAGNMNYDWKDVMQCSLMWPCIEQLLVPNNRITSLEFMNNDMFSELKVLSLEGNPIESWEEVNKLGQLPSLEQLSLYGTSLKNIQIKENSFTRLWKLSVSNNRISQWIHVSELDKLPLLTDLKICGNPELKAESYETVQQWIIARIGKIQVLNGSQVTSEDRRGAELDYLKYNGMEYLNCVQSSNSDLLKDFFTRHPRYQFLVGKYGPPEMGELQYKPTTLRNTLITLRLTSGTKSFEKKLPSTMAVQKLKTLCHRLFHLGSSELGLYSASIKNPDFHVPLDNDLRPLSFYSLEDGDSVIVEAF